MKEIIACCLILLGGSEQKRGEERRDRSYTVLRLVVAKGDQLILNDKWHHLVGL